MRRNKIKPIYVKNFIDGKPDSFEPIFMFYKDGIYNFANSIVKNQTDAEEVVQETFIKVIEKKTSLKKIDSFHAWIFTIAYHEAYQVFRKRKYLVEAEREVFENSRAMENVNEAVDNKLLQEEIEKAIHNLPQDLFEVSYFRYIEDFKMKEIAKLLDMPLGTVKSKLNRAKKQLQQDLEGKGVLPETYLASSFAPIIIDVFQNLYAQELSAVAANQIYTKTMTAMKGLQPSISRPRISKASKITLGITTVLALGYGGYVVAQPQQIIEKIMYPAGITNQNIEVIVLVSEDVKEADIVIQQGEKEIAYTTKGKEVSFEVTKNGTYTISINKESQEVVIDTIDKEYPQLSDVKYENGTISFSLTDTQTEIDYEASYIINTDKQPLPKDHQIQDIKSPSITLCVYDIAGNYAEYDINIKDLVSKP